MENKTKGYYLFSPEEASHALPSSGVNKKVHAQTEALQEYINFELLELPPITYSGSIVEKIYRRLPFTAAWRKWKYNGEFDDASFVYIRQVYHDASFIRYLKQIKKRNSNIKIIYEIPTYPFEQQAARSVSGIPFVLKELVNQKKLRHYVDRIVTFYGQKEIFGIRCINLINGYDYSAVTLPRREKTNSIHIISVALTSFWHGYDRFLAGLAAYYENGGTEDIVYHYVGSVMPEHEQFVHDHHLENHVIFHGKQSGASLKALFKESFLGIDVLGGHRKNYPISSSLKSREYFAYGLPLITSSPVDFLPSDYPFQLIVPYDDSPVDMESVIRFYHEIYDGKDCNQVAAEIRTYAEARCDMKITMKPVADWLMKETK